MGPRTCRRRRDDLASASGLINHRSRSLPAPFGPDDWRHRAGGRIDSDLTRARKVRRFAHAGDVHASSRPPPAPPNYRPLSHRGVHPTRLPLASRAGTSDRRPSRSIHRRPGADGP
jgi:hypothetical protein